MSQSRRVGRMYCMAASIVAGSPGSGGARHAKSLAVPGSAPVYATRRPPNLGKSEPADSVDRIGVTTSQRRAAVGGPPGLLRAREGG